MERNSFNNIYLNRRLSVEKENDHYHLNQREHTKLESLMKKMSLNEQAGTTHMLKELPFKEIGNISRSLSLYQSTDRTKFSSHFVRVRNDNEEFCYHYGKKIIEDSTSLSRNSHKNKYFLSKHEVDGNLRARMLDWMVEVMSSYKFNHKTYFAGVSLMDRYFQLEQSRIPITKLHIIGVQSMLIATKMQEVFPLKLKTVHEKIVHRKIQRRDLVEMQSKISSKLDFKLNSWTFYDLAIMKIHQFGLVLQELPENIEEICSYLGKFVLYNYAFYCEHSMEVLADTLIKMAYEISGKTPLKGMISSQSVDVNACFNEFVEYLRSFKEVCKGLNNINKFSDDSVVQAVQAYINK